MCDEPAFVLYFKGGHRHLTDIDLIEVSGDTLRLKDINGNETVVNGHIRTVDFVNRRIETTD